MKEKVAELKERYENGSKSSKMEAESREKDVRNHEEDRKVAEW